MSSSLGPGSSSLGQYLGAAETEIRLPEIDVAIGQLPDGVEQETVSLFGHIYRQHLTQLMEAVVNLNFASIQHIWAQFWNLSSEQKQETEEQQISKAQMKILLTIPELQTFIQVCSLKQNL